MSATVNSKRFKPQGVGRPEYECVGRNGHYLWRICPYWRCV